MLLLRTFKNTLERQGSTSSHISKAIKLTELERQIKSTKFYKSHKKAGFNEYNVQYCISENIYNFQRSFCNLYKYLHGNRLCVDVGNFDEHC